VRRMYRFTQAHTLCGWRYRSGDIVWLPVHIGQQLRSGGVVEEAGPGPSEAKPATPAETKGPAYPQRSAKLAASEDDHVAQVSELSIEEVLERVKGGVWNLEATIAAEEAGKSRISLLRQLRKMR
jgi:hypothetical protein